MINKLNLSLIVFTAIFCLNLKAQSPYNGFEDFFYASNAIDSVISESLDENTNRFVLEGLEKYTYNSLCKPTRINRKNWDLVQKKWIDTTQTLFTYDTQTRLISSLEQKFGNNIWRDSVRINYTFPGADTGPTNSITQFFLANTWSNAEMSEFTYTTAKKVATETVKTWLGTAWTNDKRTINTYDAQNRLIGLVRETWVSTKWVNVSRETYSYNIQNKLQKIKTEEWTIPSNTWSNPDSTLFTISPDGRKISFNFSVFGITIKTEFLGSTKGLLNGINFYLDGNLLVGRSRFVYNVGCQTLPTRELAVLNNVLKISPNPVTESLAIQLKEVENERFIGSIYNIAGHRLENFTGQGKFDNQVDVSRLPNGLYFLSIQGEKWIANQKFVIQR